MDVTDLAESVRAGSRRDLARAITLVESQRPDHRAEATALLDALMPFTGGAIRVGISGAPGAGKSTLIEALGMDLVEAGRRVAVLAVDPSSTRTGGSILGDKTRMADLSRCATAYIRPSPSGGTLGGVARRTREALLVCEAAGFEVVLVETVGVGQSEVAVASMVDLFMLVLSPAAGDDLQGVKRGIVELADLIVVNKLDGDLAAAAGRTVADYASAAQFMRPRAAAWQPRVLGCSALHRQGIAEMWSAVLEHRAALQASGELADARAGQAVEWMWSEVTDGLLDLVHRDPRITEQAHRLEAQVRSGARAPAAAARELLAEVLAQRT